jgi:hypothetical protein
MSPEEPTTWPGHVVAWVIGLGLGVLIYYMLRCMGL